MNVEWYFSQIVDLFVTYNGGRLNESALDHDLELVRQAFKIACQSHDGQFRKSGEAFVFHSLRVALDAAKHNMDAPAIISALLHDVVEDTATSQDDIDEVFGAQVSFIVRGLTKVEMPSEGHRFLKPHIYVQQFLSQTKDFRVLFLKIFDRLDNIRTISALSPSKQLIKAKETLSIYVPTARLLRLIEVARDLETLSYRVVNPEHCGEYDRQIMDCQAKHQPLLGEFRNQLAAHLETVKIRASLVDRWRPLNGDSFEKRENGLASLYTLVVTVEDIADVYQTLGVIHKLSHPVPGKLKDHLYAPDKWLDYQAVKTTVQAGSLRVRIEITTKKLKRFFELGYLCPGFMPPEGLNDFLVSLSEGEKVFDEVALKQALKSIQVFTPKGDLVSLPDGSSALDLAFHVHEEVGFHAVSTKINGRSKGLDEKLLDGDLVLIEERDCPAVLPKWLYWVVTPKARNAIRRYLRQEIKTS